MNHKSPIGEALKPADKTAQIEMPDYCLHIAESAHEGQYRDTGQPYIMHPRKLEILMSEIIEPSEYTDVFLSSAYVHDVPEQGKVKDKKVEVYYPYNPIVINPNSTYLNTLLSIFDEEGKMVCYIAYRITHRPGTRYMDYVDKKIFKLSKEMIKRDLDIGKCLLKTIDRMINTNIVEIIDEDYYRKKFNECENKEFLIKKYRYYRWSLKHIKPKEDFSFDAYFGVIKEALIRKNLANAMDNTSTYIPKSEVILIKSATKRDKRLFNQGKMKKIIKDCMSESESIKEKFREYIDEELTANLGYNRR